MEGGLALERGAEPGGPSSPRGLNNGDWGEASGGAQVPVPGTTSMCYYYYYRYSMSPDEVGYSDAGIAQEDIVPDSPGDVN